MIDRDDMIPPLVTEAERLMIHLEPEPRHVYQVRVLAVRLFHLFKNPLHLSEKSLRYLEAGALLHDIGWSVAGKGHHKHSAALILEHGLSGASERETAVIAALARAHRKNPPRPSHQPFGSLSVSDRDLVRRLAALLRVADGLDRSHCAVVEGLDLRFEEARSAALILHCRRTPHAELFGLTKKKGLLEELLGMEIHAEVRDD